MSASLCPVLWLSLSLRLCSWPLMKQRTGCISCIRPPLSLALFHPPLSLRDMCNYVHITITVTPSPPLGSLLLPSCFFLCCPVYVPAQHSQQLHSRRSPSLFSPEFLLEFLDTTSQVFTSDSDFFFPGGPCSIFP